MPSDLSFMIILYWSDVDQRVIAEVPELAGCIADGPSYEQVIANARVMMEEWIEIARSLGRPIPAARGRFAFS